MNIGGFEGAGSFKPREEGAGLNLKGKAAAAGEKIMAGARFVGDKVQQADQWRRETLLDSSGAIGRWNLRTNVDGLGAQIDGLQAKILKLNSSPEASDPSQSLQVREKQLALTQKIDSLSERRQGYASLLSGGLERRYREPMEHKKQASAELEGHRKIQTELIAERDKFQSDRNDLNEKLTKLIALRGESEAISQALVKIRRMDELLAEKTQAIGQIDSLMTNAETRIAVIDSKYGKHIKQLAQLKDVAGNGKSGTFAMPQKVAPDVAREVTASRSVEERPASLREASRTAPTEVAAGSLDADAQKLLAELVKTLFEGSEQDLEKRLGEIEKSHFKDAKSFDVRSRMQFLNAWNALAKTDSSMKEIPDGTLSAISQDANNKSIVQLGLALKREAGLTNETILAGMTRIGEELKKQPQV